MVIAKGSKNTGSTSEKRTSCFRSFSRAFLASHSINRIICIIYAYTSAARRVQSRGGFSARALHNPTSASGALPPSATNLLVIQIRRLYGYCCPWLEPRSRLLASGSFLLGKQSVVARALTGSCRPKGVGQDPLRLPEWFATVIVVTLLIVGLD